MIRDPLEYYSAEEWEAMMAEAAKHPTPCVICKLSIVKREYEALREDFPNTDIYYAVKANPGRPILELLRDLGSCFDIASRNELDLVLSLGISPDRVSFGNTIKKSEDIRYAYEKGVRLFVSDCLQDTMKLSVNAPGSKVFFRILVPPTETADWPLSKKFGSNPGIANKLISIARENGLVPVGASFHVGSQQRDPSAWTLALKTTHDVFTKAYDDSGITLNLVNIGGGLPARYIQRLPERTQYKEVIGHAMAEYFGDGHSVSPEMRFMIEPGRSMVGNAGIFVTEVISASFKDEEETDRWVYMDAGVFHGLYETIDEAIKFPIHVVCRASRADDENRLIPTTIGGQTCDSYDTIYGQSKVNLPANLSEGDKLIFMTAGAYTNSTSFVAFNGFRPTPVYFVE